jgi:hypothetical protein
VSDTPGAGHNLPSLPSLLSADVITALIEADTTPLKARAAVLSASCARFLEAHPTITAGEQDDIAAEVLATVQRFTSANGRVETARVALKAPLLLAERAIDRAYREIGTDLIIRPIKDRRAPFTLAEQIVQRVVAYKAEKNRVAEEAAAAEANRLANVAALAERLADQGTGGYAEAAKAIDAADKAHAIAAAKPADRTRARGSDVGTTSMQKRRVFEIISPALVPREYCEPSDSLIRRAIGKAGDPLPTIPGILVRDEDDLTVRRG